MTPQRFDTIADAWAWYRDELIAPGLNDIEDVELLFYETAFLAGARLAVGQIALRIKENDDPLPALQAAAELLAQWDREAVDSSQSLLARMQALHDARPPQ